MRLAQVKHQLATGGWQLWKKISADSGVPLSTVKRLGNGTTPSPRSDTLERIADALERAKKKAA